MATILDSLDTEYFHIAENSTGQPWSRAFLGVVPPGNKEAGKSIYQVPSANG